MSLFGSITDKLAGNAPGTADAAGAAYNDANSQLMALNQQTYQHIQATQGQDAADAYWAQVQQDYSTDAPAPNSAAAVGQEFVAGAQGALQGAKNEAGGTFDTITKLLAQIKAVFTWIANNTWFIWLAVLLFLFVLFDGPELVRRFLSKKKL